jgi:peroxin-1
VASKLVIAPDVDFAEVASKTEGFSGADLQALLYNAHLDVIHSAVAEAPTTTSTANKPDEVPLEYVVFNAGENQPAMSKAEQTDLERKVSVI